MSTAAEKRYMDRVASLGCVVCRNLHKEWVGAQLHHIRTSQGMGLRSSDYLVIPLCPSHHQGAGSGVSYHDDAPAFERLYGSELKLLAQTIGEAFES